MSDHENHRKLAASIIAPLTAFSLFLFFLLAPIMVYRLWSGIPFGAKGESWEGWLLVIGGGIGAAAARLTHILILDKFGGFTASEMVWEFRGNSGGEFRGQYT
jgi:hypothetical protein